MINHLNRYNKSDCEANPMTQEDIVKYTKDYSHHGVNQTEILNRFMQYASACSDPENIFRYMEQKAICTFLTLYWIQKADYLANIGDYSSCFECINYAKSINQDEKDEVIVTKKETELVNKLMCDMRLFPLKGKRSIDQFQFVNNQSKNSIKQIFETILPIYESKYGGLRKEKEKNFRQVRQKMPTSWLAEQYEKQQIQQKKIEAKIHQNSMRLSREVKYHSMHTPIKFRDPQRLTKTMDSVQILRKKRSTNEKLRQNHTYEKYDSDDDFEEAFQASNTTKMVASVPVGKTMSNLKRRVTFDMMDAKKNNVKFSDAKTTSDFATSLKNVTNMGKMEEASHSADKSEELSQKFKSLPNSHKLK